jgi:hypothetical protein
MKAGAIMNISTNAAAARCRRFPGATLEAVYGTDHDTAYHLWLGDQATLAIAYLGEHPSPAVADVSPLEESDDFDPCDLHAPERDYDVPEIEPVPRRHAGCE